MLNYSRKMQNKTRLKDSLTRNKFNLRFDWWKITFFLILLFVNSGISHFIRIKKSRKFLSSAWLTDWPIIDNWDLSLKREIESFFDHSKNGYFWWKQISPESCRNRAASFEPAPKIILAECDLLGPRRWTRAALFRSGQSQPFCAIPKRARMSENEEERSGEDSPVDFLEDEVKVKFW